MASVAALAGLWILLPARAPAAQGVAKHTLVRLHGALSKDDAEGIRSCRETLRAEAHRDLLGQVLPGLLRVVDALGRVDRRCKRDAGEAFDRGVCALRQLRYQDALLAFGEIPAARGGASYREVAARLLALQRRDGRAGGRRSGGTEVP